MSKSSSFLGDQIRARRKEEVLGIHSQRLSPETERINLPLGKLSLLTAEEITRLNLACSLAYFWGVIKHYIFIGYDINTKQYMNYKCVQ